MAERQLGTVVRAARDRLRGAGIDSADLDARLLVASVVAVAAQRLGLEGDRVVTDDDHRRIEALVRRRAGREPVARILGEREFWSLPFHLSAATLEPRPDTEALVEAALEWIDARGLRNGAVRIADLGTGSGAIIVALLKECPKAFGVGTDLSDGALRTARENAGRADVGERAWFARMSYADALTADFDLIVCNPPYVRSAEIEKLAPEVRCHDPHLALDGGADGLDGYRAVAATAPALLRSQGAVMVEVGAGQAGPVGALFAEAGLEAISARCDLAGLVRVVAARHHHTAKTQGQL